jgi:hypothetical protein
VIAKDKFFVTAAMALMGYSKERAMVSKVREVEGYNFKKATHDCWISHGPLRRSPNAIVQAPLIGIVSAVRIGQEESIDVTSLEKLRKVNPIL